MGELTRSIVSIHRYRLYQSIATDKPHMPTHFTSTFIHTVSLTQSRSYIVSH